MGKETDLMENINLTKCWMSYHFKTNKSSWEYRKLIKGYVKQYLGRIWNSEEFFHYMTCKTIDYMAQIDAYPRCLAFILVSIMHAYWHFGHDLFKVKYS